MNVNLVQIVDTLSSASFSVDKKDIEQKEIPITKLEIRLCVSGPSYYVSLNTNNYSHYGVLYSQNVSGKIGTDIKNDSEIARKKKTEKYFDEAKKAIEKKRYRIIALSNGKIEAKFFTDYFQNKKEPNRAA